MPQTMVDGSPCFTSSILPVRRFLFECTAKQTSNFVSSFETIFPNHTFVSLSALVSRELCLLYHQHGSPSSSWAAPIMSSPTFSYSPSNPPSSSSSDPGSAPRTSKWTTTCRKLPEDRPLYLRFLTYVAGAPHNTTMVQKKIQETSGGHCTLSGQVGAQDWRGRSRQPKTRLFWIIEP